MGYLIHVTYYSLAGASDLTDMGRDNKGNDVRLKSTGFLAAF